MFHRRKCRHQELLQSSSLVSDVESPPGGVWTFGADKRIDQQVPRARGFLVYYVKQEYDRPGGDILGLGADICPS